MFKVLGCALLVCGFAGCGAADEVESQVDCLDICQRYSDCFDSDYDVSECQSECEGKVDEDESFLEDVSGCDNCIDDRSCSEGAFACTDDCAGIVP